MFKELGTTALLRNEAKSCMESIDVLVSRLIDLKFELRDSGNKIEANGVDNDIRMLSESRCVADTVRFDAKMEIIETLEELALKGEYPNVS
jgi:hypothetical protein